MVFILCRNRNFVDIKLNYDVHCMIIYSIYWQALELQLQTLENEKQTEKILKEKINEEKQEALNKITTLERDIDHNKEQYKAELTQLQGQIDQMKHELDISKKEAKQSSMMDLEIADYERQFQSLQDQMAQKDKVISESQTEIRRQEEKVESLQKQLGEHFMWCLCFYLLNGNMQGHIV